MTMPGIFHVQGVVFGAGGGVWDLHLFFSGSDSMGIESKKYSITRSRFSILSFFCIAPNSRSILVRWEESRCIFASCRKFKYS